MGEVSFRSVACYPWALSAGPWSFRRVVRVRVHIVAAAVRIEPRGQQAGVAPSLVIPLERLLGADASMWRLWLRTRDQGDDPVGLGSARWRIAPALRAAGVPEAPTSQGRDRGWSRPGTLLLAFLVAAIVLVRSVATETVSGWVGVTGWVALVAWYLLLAPRGPYAGRRLLLTDGGWVEEPQPQPTPA